MSLASTRQSFADVLSGVAGVQGYPKRPAAPSVGDAWPVWRIAALDDNSQQFTNGWDLLVYMPQDEAAADDWIDDHIQELIEALEPVAAVDSYQPANLAPSGSSVFGLLINTRSE